MKLTLAFCVYNKADTIASVLASWLSTLSGQHTYEVIVVCDACVDGTQAAARAKLRRFSRALESWTVLDTADVYEIAANNAALATAAPDSELIVFIQDDNWAFSPDWDVTLINVRALVERPGCTALLAGGLFHPGGMTYERVESDAPHKGEDFTGHGIPADKYPPGVYSVDFITRPFVVSTPLLREVGGLGAPGFDVICWDDTDLSIKLLRQGYVNQYVALDVLNTCSGQQTMKERMATSFTHNLAIFRALHHDWLAARETNSYRFIAPLERA